MNLPRIALTVLTLLVAAQCASAANPEPMGTDVDIIAKLAKEKAKRHGQDGRNSNQSSANALNGESDAACGNVDIGNFVGGNKGGRGPREITVVITGDVINANNKCK